LLTDGRRIVTQAVLQSRRSVLGLVLAGVYILVTSALLLLLLDDRFNAAKRDKLIQDDAYDPQIRRAFDACVSGMKAIRLDTVNEGVTIPFDSLVPSRGVYSATMGSQVYTFPLSLTAQELHDPIDRELRKAISGDNIFFRAEFYPATQIEPRETASEPAVVVEDRQKKRRLNTFSNNLLTRDFENLVLYRMGHVGRIVLYYTSPTDAAWMAALVARYRWYSFLVVVVCLLVVGIVVREVASRRAGRQPPVQAGG
jgi:hypothetical protein